TIQHTPESVLVAFGFGWEPTWNEKDKGPVPMSTVRAAWKALPPDPKRDEEVAKMERKMALEQEHLPYGIIRNQVTDRYGQKAADAVSNELIDPVHLVTQDADGAHTTPEGIGVLAAYDKVLIGVKNQPLLTIGGYRFSGFDWGLAAGSHKQQLTELANE